MSFDVFDILLTVPVARENGAGGGDMFSLLLMIGATFLIIYLFMIAPERKRRKQIQEMLNALKKNDRVMTNGGIIGWVQRVKENEVVLKTDEKTGATITVVRHAIAQVLDVASGPASPTAAETDAESDSEATSTSTPEPPSGGKGKGKKGKR